MEARGEDNAELRAARRRLVLHADADLRGIERELHRGVVQHLVALSMALQLARRSLAESDVASTAGRLNEMDRDLQLALDEAARLAQRIYVPLHEAGGLAAALRAAAVSAGAHASVDVAEGTTCSPEAARTLYLCWLDALERHADTTRPAISVRTEERALVFEVIGVAGSASVLGRLRDRVEALEGRLVVGREPGGGTRLTGTLPLAS